MPASSPIFTATCAHELPCDLPAVAELCRQAREFFAQAGLPADELDAWELALAEAANNAVKHCRPEARNLPLRVDLLVGREWVEARVTDHTPGFDWPEQAELPPEDSESGRGIFLMQNLTDAAHYLRGRGENCLVLRKRRSLANEMPAASQPNAAVELIEARRTLDLMTEELASSYESLSAIFRFTAELESGVNSEDFIQRWLNQLLVITESDWFVLRLGNPASGQLHVAATSVPDWHGAPLLLEAASTPGNSVEAQAAARRSDVWFEASSPLAPRDPLAPVTGWGCGFAHPLFVNDTLVGVLSIGRRAGDRPFQAGQVSVVQTFGDFLGLQIRNQQMQEEQIRARLNTRDLEIAADMQRALLPEQLPSVPHATLAGFYRSAREIGGDYYDALPTADGNVLLAVADVMGKGLPAALFAFMFRSLVRARRDLASRPGAFLAWLNENLFQELDRSEMFITAQIAFLDCERGEIRVASAGHPPLLLARSTGEVTEVSAGGPPLGIIAGATFPEESHAWAGDCVLMFTDGLIEARNLQGELLGLAAVKSALASAACSGESGEVTQQRLASLLRDFESGSPPADDTAFIVIAGMNTN